MRGGRGWERGISVNELPVGRLMCAGGTCASMRALVWEGADT